ncbi:MAG TPA: glycosyltransferase family 39 protein, partial [Polyangia bacterium]
MSRADRRLGWIVFAVALAALVAGGRSQGNTRDEGYYFDAAELYWSWYGDLVENTLHGAPQRSFTRAAVDRGFGYNHEHPALMKSLFGLSWRVLHQCHCPEQGGRHPIGYGRKHVTLGLLDEEAAMRLPTDVLAALMAMLVFLLGATVWSRAAGLVAATLTLAAPRLFFDAQLAAFDAPIAAMWVAVVYAYWRALDDKRWGWRTGLLFGLALATKHNAFFLPAMLAPHWLFVAWQRKQRPPLRPFVYMATLGLVVYLACWPWLWFDTVNRFREYAAFHVHHVYYNMEYLGRNYNKPPFPLSFPYVMEALTLPLTTLLLGLAGAVLLFGDWWHEQRGAAPAATGKEPTAIVDTRATGLLVFINALFPMAILTVTRAPIFGATKHFHATIPFFALLAGYAVFAISSGLAQRRWLAPAFAVLVCLPAVAET